MSSDRYLREPPPPTYPPEGDNLAPSLPGGVALAFSAVLVIGVLAAAAGYLLTQVIFHENVPRHEARQILPDSPRTPGHFTRVKDSSER